MRRSIVVRVAALCLMLLPLSSYAWWNNDWNYRKEITLDTSATGANVAGSASDVPVLIRLHIGNFGYFADTLPDGADFRVVAGDDKTPLKFSIERFDAQNQMAFIWVRVPRLTGAANSDKIFLYYGNPKAAAGGEPAAIFDNSQALVYHFNEAETGLPKDATANGNNATSGSAATTVASLIGGGLTLTGSDFVQTPASASLRLYPDKGMTFSTWVKRSGEQADAYVMALQDQGNEFVLGIDGGQAFARLVGTSARAEARQTDSLSDDAWHFLAATLSHDKLQLYVDGESVATAAIAFKPNEIAGSLTLGGSATGDHAFVGQLDEVEVATTPRSPEWITLAARSQGQESTLVAYGADAQREGESVSYFAVTMRNVTPDGWVVIIILAVMFVIALLVMASKATSLSRIKKANQAFLQEFTKLRGSIAALDREEARDGDAAFGESAFMPHVKDGDDRFRLSTLYRLYHHGVQEMQGRTRARSVGAAAVRELSPQTIDAIRAAMDATSVRLTQTIQSKMVLLTIAISGGPFLGLLGTVVGVMITFAAIAASGDVNVNSIAPGIAAALAATVAGLAVAIPSLFGYNWLNTQIKEVTADMRVFIDEFVTRVAEEYS